MVVEEAEKKLSNLNISEEDNNNKKCVVGEGDEPEGGEIIDSGDDVSSSQKLNKEIVTTHPLEHSWTFWFHKSSNKTKAVPWGSAIRPMYTFSTAEEFWSLYNNMHHPSKLATGANFHCFKHKIEPKWEDPICSNGGKWAASFGKGKSDTSWLYTLLAMIGEQFDHGDDICGAVVSVRNKVERISIWTKNAANEASQVSIGQQWKKFIDYNDTIGFIIHEDAKNHDRGAKNKYTA